MKLSVKINEKALGFVVFLFCLGGCFLFWGFCQCHFSLIRFGLTFLLALTIQGLLLHPQN